MNYKRNSYGELTPANYSYELWVSANNLIHLAVKSKKIDRSYDTISFTRRGRADGSARHHEIYDIHPDPIRVLLCVRETEGTKYGVATTSKNYYIIGKQGRGVKIADANKFVAAKAAKHAGCELGCAINILEGKAKLTIKHPDKSAKNWIAYKKLAVLPDGRMYSIYDGSEYCMGKTRTDRAMKNHNGGLYAYMEKNQAKHAEFPDNSKFADADKIIVKCLVSGNFVQYDNGKHSFSEMKIINVEEILA